MKKLFTILTVLAVALGCNTLFAQSPNPHSMIPQSITGVPVNTPPRQVSICPPCAILENEPYITSDGIDDVNGGCYGTPPRYSPISIGDVYCSNTNTYVINTGLMYSDEDWYQVVLTEAKTVYFSVYSPITGRMWINTPPCNNLGANAFAQSNPGVYSISATLQPGTYWMVYEAWQSMGNGGGVQYLATVTTTPPGDPSTWCPPAAVPTLSQWGLILLGAALLGMGTVYIIRMKRASV